MQGLRPLIIKFVIRLFEAFCFSSLIVIKNTFIVDLFYFKKELLAQGYEYCPWNSGIECLSLPVMAMERFILDMGGRSRY